MSVAMALKENIFSPSAQLKESWSKTGF